MLALLLCFTFMFTLTTPVFASTNESINSTITLESNNDGTWSPIKERTTFKQKQTMTLNLKENADNIYVNKDNEYYQEIEDNIYIQVEEITLPATEYETYLTLQSYNYPQEVLDDVASMASYLNEKEIEDVNITIFVPSTNARLNSKGPVTTTWNGLTFHNYEVWFTQIPTGFQDIVKGSSATRAAVSAIQSLVINAVGSTTTQIGTAISLFSTGVDCLTAWQNARGTTPLFGYTQNAVQVNVTYDLYLKYTFYYNPVQDKDYFGCGSQKAIIRKVHTMEYFIDENGGDTIESELFPNKSYYSPNYNYPEETAFDFYLYGYSETVRGKVHNKNIIFTWPNYTWPSNWPAI